MMIFLAGNVIIIGCGMHRKFKSDVRRNKVSEKSKEMAGKAENYKNAALEISKLSKALNAAFVDRDDEVRCCLLALAAREHCVLIGAAGTSKSLLIEKISEAVGLKYFHTLLCKDSKADQLFGPLSINAIKQDVRKRVTTNRLPEADMAFLDEVFKANSTILNNLLTAMNERKFENPTMQTIPLKTVFGASNELPQEKVLDALYDRFLIRRWVKSLRKKKSIFKLLKNDGLAKVSIPTIDWKNFELIYEASKVVEDCEKTLEAYYSIVTELGITSDRRILKAYRLMKVYAALSGRDKLNRKDLIVLKHVLWNKKEEINIVAELRATNIGSKVKDATNLFEAWISNLGLDVSKVDNIDELIEDISNLGDPDNMMLLQDARKKSRAIETELKALSEEDDDCMDIYSAFQECKEEFNSSLRKAFEI
jgi:MoxR-like ATPase